MMTYVPYLVFAFYLTFIVAGASIAVFSKNMVRALVGFVGTIVGIAGMYLLMQAPFLALMQLLIYIGAICAIIFFAMMLSDTGENGDESTPVRIPRTIQALLAGILILVVLVPPLVVSPVASSFIPANVVLADIGKTLLEDYLLAFELISVILLVSMAGGVLLAWDRRKQ